MGNYVNFYSIFVFKDCFRATQKFWKTFVADLISAWGDQNNIILESAHFSANSNDVETLFWQHTQTELNLNITSSSLRYQWQPAAKNQAAFKGPWKYGDNLDEFIVYCDKEKKKRDKKSNLNTMYPHNPTLLLNTKTLFFSLLESFNFIAVFWVIRNLLFLDRILTTREAIFSWKRLYYARDRFHYVTGFRLHCARQTPTCVVSMMCVTFSDQVQMNKTIKNPCEFSTTYEKRPRSLIHAPFHKLIADCMKQQLYARQLRRELGKIASTT